MGRMIAAAMWFMGIDQSAHFLHQEKYITTYP
ncbi:hypothetical protein EDC32_10144 [Laceyella sacchari]|nr:hypothetical protein EDC32_10144 [Laceyella sacchari]